MGKNRSPGSPRVPPGFLGRCELSSLLLGGVMWLPGGPSVFGSHPPRGACEGDREGGWVD